VKKCITAVVVAVTIVGVLIVGIVMPVIRALSTIMIGKILIVKMRNYKIKLIEE